MCLIFCLVMICLMMMKLFKLRNAKKHFVWPEKCRIADLTVVRDLRPHRPKTCYLGKNKLATLPKRRRNFLSRNTACLASFWIFGKFCDHNVLRFYSNSSRQQQVADALYGVNAGAERTSGTACVPQRLAVLPARPNSPGKSWGGCCL